MEEKPKSGCPSLQDFIQREIEHLEKLLSARMDAGDKALLIQTSELERRLNELNHAHAKSQEERDTFLTKEVYSVDMKGRNAFYTAIISAISASIVSAGMGILILKLLK